MGALIRVAVVGLGVIGKRLVDAVQRHPGMEPAGVAVRNAGPAVRAMPDLRYFADAGAAPRLRAAGAVLAGELPDLLAAADVVVDCGPSGTAVRRAPRYFESGVPAIFCGGERSAALGPLIHPAINYGRAAARPGCRLTSCNTTALGRLAAALPSLEELEAVVLRCATDTDKAGKGITNGAVLSGGPSHHASDLRAVLPSLRASSTAATVAMTSGHCIHVRLTFASDVSTEELLHAGGPRLVLRGPGTRIDTGELKAAMAFRRWHNRYEVFGQAVRATRGRRHELWLSLDNEAVTVPEMLDLVHAALGHADAAAVRCGTDAALGIPAMPAMPARTA